MPSQKRLETTLALSQGSIEILDLDPAVNEGEVSAAVHNAIMVRNDNPLAVAEAEKAVVTGL